MRAPQDYGRVAVLYGGRSAEREVSLKSGAAALAALRQAGVDAIGVDAAAPDLLAQLTAGGFARAFIALHGRGGEDGTLQGALDWLGLPYTGSGVLGSALAMDKQRAKQVWQGCGLPTAPYALAGPDSDWDALAARLGLPLMVKPSREGSSIGMSKVERAADLPAAVAAAMAHDSAGADRALHRRRRVHRRHRRQPRAAGHQARNGSRVLRLRSQVPARRHPLSVPVRAAGGAGTRPAAAGAGRVRGAGLQSAGAGSTCCWTTAARRT